MTNILAKIIVMLVTNTVTTDNAVFEQIPNGPPEGSNPFHAVYYGTRNGRKLTDATEKTETQSVYEAHLLQWEYRGQTFTQEMMREFKWKTEQRFKLASKWQRVEPEMGPTNVWMFTNQSIRILTK